MYEISRDIGQLFIGKYSMGFLINIINPVVISIVVNTLFSMLCVICICL
ncbi:hypothetical protein EHF_0756 [Ehrlichia japonica]|uniref:Uncharacterized protein n=1 Tax=Ehrlichia japonica TaxID=391036 RepID=X5GK26_9RICK|nr:hypothetical protein EHF_0756 [Ehrlichia japonica]